MRKRIVLGFLALTILAFIPVECLSQNIENVRPEQVGSMIHIYYDLSGVAAEQPVVTRVYLSTDGGISYGNALRNVTGDVGLVFGSGENKEIIWDVLKEVDELVSQNIMFRVKADPLGSGQERLPLKPVYVACLNPNLGSRVEMNSYGLDLKVVFYLRQLGLGVRGSYYRNFGSDADPSGEGYYWGFSGGAVMEYDFIKSRKYSLYPFMNVGQTKILHRQDSFTDEHSGYSIFYSPGLGFNIRVFKFIYLGLEIEYMMAPRVDIVDRGSVDVVDNIILDGFSAGIVLKFALFPD